MIVKYCGHSCILAENDGNSVIIDPFLKGNPASALSPEDVTVNAVIVTHGHMDHVGDSVEIAKRNNCPIVAIDELCKHFVRYDASLSVHRLGVGGSFQFPWGKVKLVPAFHGIGCELFGAELAYAMPVGVLLTMGGKTLYHAGDTAVFGDMKLIGELNPIDLAALPIGGNYTMDAADSIAAAKMIGAKKYMPIHYSTFGIIKQDDAAWLEALNADGLDGVILKIGETLEL